MPRPKAEPAVSRPGGWFREASPNAYFELVIGPEPVDNTKPAAEIPGRTTLMGIETFPEIESFQKLPRQVILKGGASTYNAVNGAELRGIVINNTGNAIKDIRVNIVIFDARNIPIYNTGVVSDPSALTQGGVASFLFQIKDYPGEIKDYYLYSNWRFDD